MTHGWRRFVWRDVLQQQSTALNKTTIHQPEQLKAVGRLLLNNKPLKNVRVWTQDHSQFSKTDNNGYFAFSGVSLPLSVVSKYRGINATQIIRNYSEIPSPQDLKQKRERVFAQRNEMAMMMDDVAEVEVLDEEPQMEMEQNLIAEADGDGMFDLDMQWEMEEKKAIRIRGVSVLKDFKEEEKEAALALEAVMIEMPAPAAPRYDFATGKKFKTPNLYIQPNRGNVSYHQARQFYAPSYYPNNLNQNRGGDRRQTLYWNPNISTNENGKATINYFNGDIENTFRIILEGISNQGVVVRNEHTYSIQKLVSIQAKFPTTVTHGDILEIPITIKNNQDKIVTGKLSANGISGMKAFDVTLIRNISIPPNNTHTEYYTLEVDQKSKGIKNYGFTFQHDFGSETIQKPIEIIPKGFPRAVAMSSKELQRTFTFNVNDILGSSLDGEINFYPNIMDELLTGTESIIREPYGCFEQTSSSNYPNIMVLKYMKSTNQNNPNIEQQAKAFLKKGYARLSGYECPSGGFEWWGKDPGHETLTAYGLLQFSDMQDVYNGVDQNMIDRTKNWLLKKRDGKGGYKQRGGGLDSFRGSAYEVGNAYITYALTQSGETDLLEEVEYSTKEALESKDAYRLALMALSNFNIDREEKAITCLEELRKQFNFLEDEKIQVKETVTRSYGVNRLTETAALFASGLMRQKKTDMAFLDKLIVYISGKRSSYGGFGSTQSTILALQAFTDYATIMGSTKKSGRMQVFANGNKIHEFRYNEGHRGKINVNLQPHLKKGENKITVAFDETDEALPYSGNITWTSLTPDSSPNCRLDLTTSLAKSNTKVGETVRLSAKIKNIHSENIPTPIALIGIPAGLSLQPWQLKEMTEKGIMDYYEIRGNYLIAYFTEIEKGKERILHLDLKADIPGSYKAAASTAYLYYDKQDKDWEKGTEITITN